MEPPPACPRCLDVGFLRRDVPVGHPDFGKIVPCACRAEQIADQRRERLRRAAQLGAMERLRFESLLPDGRRPEPASRRRFRAAYEQARRFAAEPDGWLVLLGPNGCGKTHLAAAIVNARLEQGEPAIFCVVPDLLDHLRQTFSPASEVGFDEQFEAVRTTPLLVLDDLGSQASTPWAMEKLFQLLNHRFAAQIPTVVTLSQPLEEVDERLRARLADPQLSLVVQVEEWEPLLLQGLGGLGQGRLREMTFETFEARVHVDHDAANRNLADAVRRARRFAEAPDGWLVLLGLPGRGKTHLAAAIANDRQARGHEAFFVTAPDLLDHLRASFAPDSRVPYDRVFEAVRSAPLLVLDDLGAQSSTPWALEKLFQLLNHRYVEKLPTVVTTNLPLADHDARIRSRMSDQKLCQCFVIDTPPYVLAQPGPSAPPSGRRPGPRGPR